VARFVPNAPYFWGVWSFSGNKNAAKELLTFLCERDQVQRLCKAVDGYDIPPFESMTDFDVWAEVEPPKGTVYNYPVRPFHRAKRSIAGFPAPPDMAVQIYNRGTMPTMIAKLTQGGQSMEQVLAWAQDELEGFRR
jgi:hypothetical protein